MCDAPGDDGFETITSGASAREADQGQRFVRDPDYDELRHILNTIGETIRVRAN